MKNNIEEKKLTLYDKLLFSVREGNGRMVEVPERVLKEALKEFIDKIKDRFKPCNHEYIDEDSKEIFGDELV